MLGPGRPVGFLPGRQICESAGPVAGPRALRRSRVSGPRIVHILGSRELPRPIPPQGPL